MERTLTIGISSDWQSRLADAMSDASSYQGERLDFATPALFFSKLTNNRWTLVNTLLGNGEIGVRELARRLGRDVKRVHEDASVLVALGLVERTESGGLICPYSDIHVDMHMKMAA